MKDKGAKDKCERTIGFDRWIRDKKEIDQVQFKLSWPLRPHH